MAQVNESLTDTKVALAESRATLKLYEGFGSPAEVHAKLQKLALFESIDENPEELKSAVEDATATIEALTQQLDDANNQLTETKDELRETPETYKTMLSEAEETKAQLDAFKELADSPEQVQELISTVEVLADKLDEYKEIGSVDEINGLVEAAEEVAKQQEEQQVQNVADELGVEKEVVESLTKKGMSIRESRKLLRKLKECNFNENDEGTEDPEEKPEDKDPESFTEALNRVPRGRGKRPSGNKARKAEQPLVESLMRRLKTPDLTKRTNVR